MTNWIDILIIVLIGSSTLFGLFHGLIKSAISLISWLIAIVLATHFYPDLASKFHGLSPSIANVVAYGIIFGAIIAIGIILSFILTRVIFLSLTLTLLNSVLGGLFGVFRGAIFVTALTYVGMLSPIVNSPSWKDSSFIGYFVGYATSLGNLIPNNLKEEASEFSVENLKEVNTDNLKSKAQHYLDQYKHSSTSDQ